MSRQRAVHNPVKRTVKTALFVGIICMSVLSLNALGQDIASANNKQPTHTNPIPASILKELPNAKRVGMGTFRWFGIQVYDVQLWANNSGANFDYKKEKYWLELNYARAFEGVKIAERSREEMEKIGAGTTVQRESWEKQLAALLPNVEIGTRLSAIHLPGGGAKFFKDGKDIGQLTETEFAQAFFGIWLDKKSSAPALRERLLGLAPN